MILLLQKKKKIDWFERWAKAIRSKTYIILKYRRFWEVFYYFAISKGSLPAIKSCISLVTEIVILFWFWIAYRYLGLSTFVEYTEWVSSPISLWPICVPIVSNLRICMSVYSYVTSDQVLWRLMDDHSK